VIWATSTWLLGEFGHLHNNRQKVTRIRKSIGKRRGTRLSKNCFDWSRDGGAVSEIGGYIFLGFRVLDYNRPARSVRPPPQQRQKIIRIRKNIWKRKGARLSQILLIGEEMVRL
jgi:hypothetical protein